MGVAVDKGAVIQYCVDVIHLHVLLETEMEQGNAFQ